MLKKKIVQILGSEILGSESSARVTWRILSGFLDLRNKKRNKKTRKRHPPTRKTRNQEDQEQEKDTHKRKERKERYSRHWIPIRHIVLAQYIFISRMFKSF